MLMSDGWFDLGEEQNTSLGSRGMLLSGQGGDGMPGIWEEPKLCAHPTDLFMLLSHVQHESPEE